MKIKLTVLFIALAFLVGIAASALAEDLTAEQIVQKSLDREKGKNRKADMEMILKKGSSEKIREFTQWTLESANGSKSLIRFVKPANLKGTAFLSWENKDRDDDQWLYMAESKNLRRIASSGKTGSFLGSDLSYEDLSEQKASDRAHTIVAQPLVDGKQTWLIESVLKPGKDSGYQKTRTWICKDNFVPLKIEMYDDKGRHTKTLNVKKYEQIDGVWTMTEFVMETLKKKTQTTMKVKQVEYGVDIDPNMMKKDALKRI